MMTLIPRDLQALAQKDKHFDLWANTLVSNAIRDFRRSGRGEEGVVSGMAAALSEQLESSHTVHETWKYCG